MSPLLSSSISDLKHIIRGFQADQEKTKKQIETLQNKFHISQNETRKLENENRFLLEQLRYLQAKLFGKKSEAFPAHLAQLFDESELEEKKEKAEERIQIAAHEKRKPKREMLPEHLPREEVMVEIPIAERRCDQGHELQEMGEEISEQLDIEPMKVKVKRTIRKKYACPKCTGYLKTAENPPTAIPKSMAAPGLLSYIAVSKYVDALPLYRLEEVFSRCQVELSRGTMASWMIKVGGVLTPLWNLLNDELLESGYIHCDETRVQVLKEPGKTAESLSYMWVRAREGPGVPPIILFNYAPSRSGQVPVNLLEGYQGYLQVDGYEGYNTICASPQVTRVGCFAHVRRKFFEAAQASKKGTSLSDQALSVIQTLYAVEKEIKDQPIATRLERRSRQSKPILDQFFCWLEKHLGAVPPQSKLGQALGYTLRQWPSLTVYCQDGRLSIDNNFVENAIRPFAIGRKNWLFSDSQNGAEASSIIYSIAQTAKANGLNLNLYFRTILEKIPFAKTADDYDKLLPHKITL